MTRGIPDSFPTNLPAGTLLVSVMFVRVGPDGEARMKRGIHTLDTGGGPELERLRLLEAAVLIAQKCAIDLESKGWAPDKGEAKL